MSIPLLPHSNFLIQSLQPPCFPFSQGKESIQIHKETEYKKTTNTIIQIRKNPRTSSTKHEQTRTKRNSHFHAPNAPLHRKIAEKGYFFYIVIFFKSVFPCFYIGFHGVLSFQRDIPVLEIHNGNTARKLFLFIHLVFHLLAISYFNIKFNIVRL